MPLRKRSNLRRRRAGKRKAGKARRMRRSPRVLNAMKMDKATVVETQELTATPEGGNFIGHQLDQYNRALAVSKNFRYYRCKKVELEFVPFSNLFAAGTAFPELYFQVDRTQGVTNPGVALPLPTKNIMLARGCMPQKWTGVIRKSYVPSVCRLENLYQSVLGSDVQQVAGVTTTPVKYKWYATQQVIPPAPPGNAFTPVASNFVPQSLRYFGAAYFINQELAAPSAVLGTIKMRVHWEFKEPLWTTDVSATPITNMDLSGNRV